MTQASRPKIDEQRAARTEAVEALEGETEAPRLLCYPFPLRRRVIISLTLPRDLTAADVRRLAGFLSTLVV